MFKNTLPTGIKIDAGVLPSREDGLYPCLRREVLVSVIN